MERLIKWFLGKKTWKCNVAFCANEVEYSGAVCYSCRNASKDFRREQESLDEWFKKFTDPQHLGAVFASPIMTNENAQKHLNEQMNRILHQRDERIADQVNKMWLKKLAALNPPTTKI